MEKTTTLNLRVNPDVKRKAEEVLSELGISMSTAIDIYLKQISMAGGIPFDVKLPEAPKSVNADLMTADEIRELLMEVYKKIEKGDVQDATVAFKKFGKSMNKEI